MLWEVYRIMEFNSQPFDLATPSHRAASRHLKFTVKCGSYSPLIADQRLTSLFSIAIIANWLKLMLLIRTLRSLRDSSGEPRADDVAEDK
jgi:hypothetical protein